MRRILIACAVAALGVGLAGTAGVPQSSASTVRSVSTVRSAATVRSASAVRSAATNVAGLSGAKVGTTASGVQLVFDQAGRARGFGNLVDTTFSKYQVVFVQGSGSTWTTQRSTYPWKVWSVADDGVNTYALTLDADGRMHVVIHGVRSGRFSQVDLGPNYYWSPPHASTPGILNGTIVASGGRWWAVWESPPGARPQTPHIWTARTMGSPYPAHDTGIAGLSPSLTLSGSSVAMAYVREQYTPALVLNPVIVARPSGDGFTTSATLGYGATPVISSAGGVLRVASFGRRQVTGYTPFAVQLDEPVSGRWRRTTLKIGGGDALDYLYGTGKRLSLTATGSTAGGSTVAVGYNTLVSGAQCSRVGLGNQGVIARRTGSTWRYSTVRGGRSVPSCPYALVQGLSPAGSAIRAVVQYPAVYRAPYYVQLR